MKHVTSQELDEARNADKNHLIQQIIPVLTVSMFQVIARHLWEQGVGSLDVHPHIGNTLLGNVYNELRDIERTGNVPDVPTINL